jgi:hypothetical protein
MDKCPGLMGGLNDPSTSCTIECPIEETILGTLDALPGNNPLGAWGVAVAGGSTPPATSVAPVESSAPATSPVKSSTPSTSAAGGAPSNPTTTAARIASSAAGGKAESTPPVVETVAPESSSPAESSSPVTIIQTAVPTAVTVPVGGGSDTLVTSYVSETTVIWTTVTAPGSVPTSPSGSSVVDGWSYYGCYSDSIASGARVMTGIELADVGQHAVTNTKCIAYCSERGYSMAGTEYGGQCFCADTLSSESSKLDDTKCNMPCEGDESETCGGSLALSVYSKSSSTARRFHNRHLHKHIRGVSN